MGVIQNIIAVVVMFFMFIIIGMLISQAQIKNVAMKVQEGQTLFIDKLNSNNLNTVLLLTEEVSDKKLGTLIAYSIYTREKILNLSNNYIDIETILKESFDEVFSNGSYYLEVKPNFEDITLNFVIDGSNSLREEREELANKLPDILATARGDDGRNATISIFILSGLPQCNLFNQKFIEFNITGGTCIELNAINNTGHLYIDPANNDSDDYRVVYNITPPYNYPGKPSTSRLEEHYYESDWAAGVAYVSDGLGERSVAKLDMIFPMGDELSTSSFADQCFASGLTLGDRLMCDFCDLSCSDSNSTITENRSLEMVLKALEMAKLNGQIMVPIFAYSCEFYSPAINSSYKDKWFFWNKVYQLKKGKNYDVDNQETLCSDNDCKGCSTLDGTFNQVCLHPNCKSEIHFQMQIMANNTQGKVINLTDVASFSDILTDVINETIAQFTIRVGVKKDSDEIYVYERKLPLPAENKFLDLKLWVYKPVNQE